MQAGASVGSLRWMDDGSGAFFAAAVGSHGFTLVRLYVGGHYGRFLAEFRRDVLLYSGSYFVCACDGYVGIHLNMHFHYHRRPVAAGPQMMVGFHSWSLGYGCAYLVLDLFGKSSFEQFAYGR